MKRFAAYTLVFFACFLGFFAALRVNEALRKDDRSESIRPIYQIGGSQAVQDLDDAPDFRAAAKKVMPSVVTVDQFRRASTFRRNDGQLMQSGTGSGVILSRDGTIVTNNHVVQNAEEVKVRLSDGRAFSARVVGTDRRSDLAVLKIDANNLTPIELGDNSKLEVGQWVVAVGNPLGFDNTVSVGVVSSLGRSLGIQDSFLIDGIQTDAAINPGNSGGALTDAQGRLVGINSMIASPTRASVGIGFAIPVNHVRKAVADIQKYGHVRYAGLGIRYDPQALGVLQISRFRAQYASEIGYEPPNKGIIISDVDSNGTAAQAGMQALDILLEVDGKSVEDALTLTEALVRKQVGDKVSLKYWSRGQTKSATVSLQEVVVR